MAKQRLVETEKSRDAKKGDAKKRSLCSVYLVLRKNRANYLD